MPLEHRVIEDRIVCASLCRACHDACLAQVSHALAVGGPRAAAGHTFALIDCAESCGLLEIALQSDMDAVADIAAFCAASCQNCADACQRLTAAQVDAALIALCRRCAKACRRLSATA